MKINGLQNLKFIKKINILLCARKNDKYSIELQNYLRKDKKNKISVILTDYKKKYSKLINNKIYKNEYNFIILFRSHVIIKTEKLTKKTIILNLHPGPPKYRGIGCVNFALLNNEIRYGSTLHLVNNKIDHGSILNVQYFGIKKEISVEDVLDKTYKNLIKQAKKYLPNIFKDSNFLDVLKAKSKKDKWSKKIYRRKDLNSLYNLRNNLEKYNLLRATVTKKFKPYLKTDKHKLILKY